jgi:serine/threonine-protein kinase GIN4
MPSEQSPSDASNDIFSLSDRVLAEKLLFVKEVRFPIPKLILTAPVSSHAHLPLQIGFGNWGSVWLCRPRVPSARNETKLAVKLVHRSKTATTAARVRSLSVACFVMSRCVFERFSHQVERNEGSQDVQE